MKRIISLLLVSVAVLSMSVTSFADSSTPFVTIDDFRLLTTSTTGAYISRSIVPASQVTIGHSYLISAVVNNQIPEVTRAFIQCGTVYGTPLNYTPSDSSTTVSWTLNAISKSPIYFGCSSGNSSVNLSSGSFDVFNLKVYDLTQIYGAGNEPTVEDFEADQNSDLLTIFQSGDIIADGSKAFEFRPSQYPQIDSNDGFLGFLKAFNGAIPTEFALFFTLSILVGVSAIVKNFLWR